MDANSEQQRFSPQPDLIDFRSKETRFPNKSILVPAEALAHDLWPEMLARTQADKGEKGVIVSTLGNKIFKSKIFNGYNDSFTPPFLPHGLKSLVPTLRDIVLVHSHYMPEELSHLPTTAMSDNDIKSALDSNYKAVVMTDRGGVHMIADASYYPQEHKNVQLIATNALEKAKEGASTVEEVRQEIAKAIYPLGLRYYFSPNLEPLKDGNLLLDFVH